MLKKESPKARYPHELYLQWVKKQVSHAQIAEAVFHRTALILTSCLGPGELLLGLLHSLRCHTALPIAYLPIYLCLSTCPCCCPWEKALLQLFLLLRQNTNEDIAWGIGKDMEDNLSLSIHSSWFRRNSDLSDSYSENSSQCVSRIALPQCIFLL